MLNVTARELIHSRFPAHAAGYDLSPPAEPQIKPVVTHFQRLAASMLVRRMYSWRGYLTDNIPDRLDNPHRISLAAWQDDEVVATLALGRDSHHGLLAEALYAKEIAELRSRSRTICEISQFAIDPEYSSRSLMGSLFAEAHQHARHSFGATDAVIEVNPRHSRYYEREFGFRQIGDLRVCPRVDAPAVLMHREVSSVVKPLT